jgi:hypothetical protein
MLSRIFVLSLGILFGSVVAAATILVKHLSRGTIPPKLGPVADRWVSAGYDPKRFRLLLWLCFWFLAAVFFAAVGYGLYLGATDLGSSFRNWK